MIRHIFTLALIFVTTLSLSAQVTTTSKEFPSRSSQPRTKLSKKAKERKLDVFNTRRFKSFLYAEANYGVMGSFSKDEAYTVAAPVSLGLGYRISPTWSVGVRAGQSVYNSDMYYYDRTFETRAETRLQIATANVNAHFPLGLRGEAYGGFAAGYQNTDITALEDGPKTDQPDRTVVRPQEGFFFTGQIGARYSLSSAFSIQGELTSGLSTLNVGIRYRLR
ncbi:hypothetical protein CEQ90_04000 [Lewinellaceae bacterium SD302]|nr:hypothetical protein CEQ90_04000 [Lewinellaceae bacterium SD302]